MLVKDRIPQVKGHWACEVYEGDVERRPLTTEQRRENAIWRRICKEAGWTYLPIHVGEVVSKPVDRFEGDNLVTTAGKGLLLDRLFNMPATPAGALTAMGVGNSATAAAVGDTQLLGATPVPDLRLYDALPTRSGLVATAIRTYATAEGNMNWQELGLFNGVTNGTSTLFNRISPIGPFNKTSAVSIVVTVTITQS